MQNNQKISISLQNTIINVDNITFSYNQREDRILFILNHANIQQRIDFFVTRRMLIQLLEAFDKILINNCDNGKLFKQLYNNQEVLNTPKIIISKEKQKTKSKNNDKALKIDDNSSKSTSSWEKTIATNELNFTKINEPIILDSLSYTIINNNITFKYIANNKVLAISKLDTTMYQRTLSSMMRVIPFMAWGISPNILD